MGANQSLPYHGGSAKREGEKTCQEPAPLVVELAGVRIPVEGRYRSIIAALLRDGEDMDLNRETVRGVAFDWGSGWFNWEVQQGKRRQEDAAA